LLDLGESFDGDLVFADFAAKDGEEEVDEGRAEAFAVRTEEGWDALWMREGCAVGEDDVAANS